MTDDLWSTSRPAATGSTHRRPDRVRPRHADAAGGLPDRAAVPALPVDILFEKDVAVSCATA